MTRRNWGEGSIEKRSKRSWRVTVELPPDPITRKRRRHRASVRGTKRDAQKQLQKAMSMRAHGGVDPNAITTTEWLKQWLAERVSDHAISPAVAYNYGKIIEHHLVPAIGSVRLQDLRDANIRSLKSELLLSRKPGTVRRILGLLRQALNSAVTQELLARNPALNVPMPSPKHGKKERRALDQKEIEELLRVAKNTPYDMVIGFALATGARQAEVLGATWGAIDLERGTFRVTHTLQVVGGEFRMVPPKTERSRRTIELSATTVRLLREHRAAQNATQLELGEEWEDHDLVFPAERGRYWHRGTFYLGYRELVDASEIEKPREVNFHALRHTAASQWIAANVDLLTVSRRLGHASASFTLDVYAHMLPGQQGPAAEALDHLIG